ncbi:MAG: 50S ribosomal protein L7/L12 [Candidatus Sumerlaeia bacterium]|nr:50S ribosomal protein L7/L12 [Candidatus Sumerlaeia bacterium]
MSLSNQEIVDALKAKTLLEASELVKMIEETFGVSAAAPVAVAVAGGGGAPAEAAEEKTEFSVVLTEYPADAKIKVIKEVRALTGLGLKEAKDKVEALPATLADALNKDDAAKWKKQLEEVGAKVEVK